MVTESLIRYWALAAAGVLGAGIGLFVTARLHSESVRGKLRSRAKELRQLYADLVKAARRVSRAEKRLEKLRRRADSVKPRRLKEADGAFQDARALQRIVEDKVLIAENHVRKLIVEEFPPKRQERLRERYLKRPERDGRPFSFG